MKLKFVLEYANKGNLFYYIKDNEYLSESQSFKIFIQIVNAIYFLHKNNFIHRDIKPENILLFDKNIAKLCDFGWCVEFKDEPRNTFCGTTEYMAPEMLNEKNYGKEIDIWSLGILLYEMLHGHSPFKPDKANFNDKDVIKNIIYQKNIKYKSNLSKECIELMTHLIDKNIKRRYSLEDIINSKFVKKFEKSTNNYKLKNIREFQKINSKNTIKTINTTRTNYTNNYLEQKDKLTINKNPNINRRNTSKYNTRKLLNSFLSMENDNSNNYIINKENSCKNIINNSNSQRNGKEISQQNNFSFRTISPTNTKKLNLKFSSPKIDKINKNKIQREEDFENDNLSNIFNDHSIFNNYKENKNSNNNNYKNPPTININILLNEINFSSNNNNNYEQKILDKIFGSDKTNSFKKIINSPQSSRINSSKLINRDNNFIKNRINIFTSKNFNINNLNDKKSFNNPKNIPISIRPKNDNISNNSEINEFKNNKLIKEGKTSNLTNIDDSSKNNPLYISNNLEIIKTPKKEEDTFLLKTKFIFSNLSEELRIFNNKK